jgi:hypothetical protein
MGELLREMLLGALIVYAWLGANSKPSKETELFELMVREAPFETDKI